MTPARVLDSPEDHQENATAEETYQESNEASQDRPQNSVGHDQVTDARSQDQRHEDADGLVEVIFKSNIGADYCVAHQVVCLTIGHQT